MGDTVEPQTQVSAEAKTLFAREAEGAAGIAVRRAEVGNYRVDFCPGGPALALVFAPEPEEAAEVAAHGAAALKFLAEAGYSTLHFTAKTPDWYRGPALQRWFASAAVETFLRGFSGAVFIGASMGGFAAITFSRLLPGALVIAHHPQSSLRADVAGWETRFPKGRAQDWSGAFADAAGAAPLARRIYITYDPFLALDKRHVDRLPGQNIVHLKLPFLGHQTSLALDQLKITQKAMALALAETLTVYDFARMTRERRKLPQYYHNAVKRVRKRKHLDALLFDAARRDETDKDMYRNAVLRMFARRRDRQGMEHYYGRLSLSYRLPVSVQGILRAQAGLADQRNDPGIHEPGLRKKRIARMEALAAAVNYQSKDVQELVVSAKFLRSLKQWRNAETLAAAALTLDANQKDAKQILAEAQKKIAEAEARLTPGQKVRKFFADLW